jgi:hypothetical protein
MWRASILALIVLLVAPAAAPARVLQSVTPDGTLAEGPLLAGARVAWEETRCLARGGCGFEASRRYRIRAAGPRRVTTLTRGRLRSLPGGSNALFDSVSFDLSPRRFVLGWSTFGTSNEQDFWEGGLLIGGPEPTRLKHVPGGGCRAERFTVDHAFALTGAVLAYDRDPCDERPVLVLRDGAAGTVRRVDLGPPAGSLTDIAIAGRWVASTHGRQLQVHDVETGAELFSAPLPPGTLHGIDVARDGRVAVTVGSERLGRRTCWPSRLWLLAAGGSALEEQPVSPCWDARLVRAGVVYLAGERRPLRLELQTGAGVQRTLVAFGARRVRENFDAQGTRGAIAIRCGGRVRIRVISIYRPSPVC